jgi:flagellar basal body-associated protein FliL
VKSPEEIAKEEEDKKIADAKKKKRRRNIIIGVVGVALVVTAIIGYKKGWFGKLGKGEINPS